MIRFALVFVTACTLLSCTKESSSTEAIGCVLASDCTAPLVCRAARCRVECSSARDCPEGQVCVSTDGSGSCLFADEWRCTLDSDCGDPLVCLGGACVNACSVERNDSERGGRNVDCPGSETCVATSILTSGGGLASRCVPVAMSEDNLCELNSDCALGNTCGVDAMCHEGCARDADCPPAAAFCCDYACSAEACTP